MPVKLEATLNHLVFSNDLQVELSKGSILAIIGPNNSGKSTAINEIKGLVNGEIKQPKILKAIEMERLTSISQIKEQLSTWVDKNGVVNIPGSGIMLQQVEHFWSKGQGTGTFLSRFLFSDLTTRNRLSDCGPVPSLDVRNTLFADHPFQLMYVNDDLEAIVSATFRKAFKKDFVVHRVAGSVIPVYVGDRPKVEEGEDRVSRSYLERLQSLDRLEDQGDGMQSFASVAARVITENRPIRLIDEPEAFLHPPQAKILASTIAQRGHSTQTVIATHSSDIIQGLLSDNGDRVSVVRLRRTANGSSASLLTSEDISRFWNDPVLRFSNVMNGLFHDGVIITEGDPDCRFYEGMASKSVSEDDQVDIHYAYAGGKDRVPVLVAALTAVNVPVASVLDFDVLNNEQPLRRIIDAHGGKWEEFEPDWRYVKDSVESKKTFLGGDQYSHDVTALLKTIPKGQAVPKEVLSAIRKLTRNASPWDNVKEAGLNIVPPGKATITAVRLIKALANIGIFVAPLGQMEGFCRTIDRHGIRWVEEVMKRDLATDTELSQARTFVSSVLSFLKNRALA